MNHAIRLLLTALANLPQIACVAAAYHLAVNGVSSWGWFLLIAILI